MSFINQDHSVINGRMRPEIYEKKCKWVIQNQRSRQKLGAN